MISNYVTLNVMLNLLLLLKSALDEGGSMDKGDVNLGYSKGSDWDILGFKIMILHVVCLIFHRHSITAGTVYSWNRRR